jgi:hypothetical protein
MSRILHQREHEPERPFFGNVQPPTRAAPERALELLARVAKPLTAAERHRDRPVDRTPPRRHRNLSQRLQGEPHRIGHLAQRVTGNRRAEFRGRRVHHAPDVRGAGRQQQAHVVAATSSGVQPSSPFTPGACLLETDGASSVPTQSIEQVGDRVSSSR